MTKNKQSLNDNAKPSGNGGLFFDVCSPEGWLNILMVRSKKHETQNEVRSVNGALL